MEEAKKVVEIPPPLLTSSNSEELNSEKFFWTEKMWIFFLQKLLKVLLSLIFNFFYNWKKLWTSVSFYFYFSQLVPHFSSLENVKKGSGG